MVICCRAPSAARKAPAMDEPTIYIVDDDVAVQAATRRLLRQLGFPVRLFGSAEEFLAAVRPGALGCLVLDLSLPGMSGMELQEHMAAQGWQLTIVFVTSHFDQASHDSALRRGAAAFLSKPFGLDQLLAHAGGAMAAARKALHGVGHLSEKS
jgi:FixJ family two-component response regulator